MRGGKRPDRRRWRVAGRHARRLDGAIAILLLLLPWLVVLLVWPRVRHLDVGTAIAVFFGSFAVSLGLPMLWLMWTTYRGPKRGDTPVRGLSLGQVADQLAVAVGAQWNAEAAVRRLNDPYPLPVSWVAADASLTDAWESLVRLATSGVGWPPPAAEGAWAEGPDDLAGEGGELVDVLAQVPTRRLVVLGEPGAGKTMLMVRLVLDLLSRRTEGSPVPFLASVASWDPTAQDLRRWLGVQLLTDHPALANTSSEGIQQSTQADALLASGLILPVLDGLDEIPDEVRGPAISRINDALRPGEQVMVTCRTRQFRDAVQPEGGVGVTLRAAAAVQLRPLDADTVRDYLCDDAAGPVAKARWDPVLTVLGTEAPAGQALRTPLMVALARTIYNPRPGELVGTLRDPAELCSPALTDRRSVESLLFDAFIPAAYRHDPGGRWKAQDAERWLVFLARHLEGTIASPDLAWWQLQRAVSGFALATGAMFGAVCGIVGGAVSGIVAGADAAIAGSATGAVLGVVAGVMSGPVIRWRPGKVLLGIRLQSQSPIPRMRLRSPSRGLIATGSLAWAATGAIFGAVAGGAIGAAVGTAAGAVFGPVAATVQLEDTPLDLSFASSPPAVLAAGRRAGIGFGIAAGAVAGITSWVFFGGLAGAGTGAVAGAVLGVMSAVLVSYSWSAWPSYEIARMVLVLHRSLPWQLMGFLADAHRRGVFRQAGAVYQFRHIELQHRLANRGTGEPQANSPAAAATEGMDGGMPGGLPPAV